MTTMHPDDQACVERLESRYTLREGETESEHARRIFEERKAEALAWKGFGYLDHPEPMPNESPRIVALRSKLTRLVEAKLQRVRERFDAEEALMQAQAAEEDAHSAYCNVFRELHVALDNCEIIVWRKNGRGRKRTLVEVLPNRGTQYGLSLVVRELNAKYASEGSGLVADLHERPYPPGVEEPADEPEPVEAFMETRRLACA